MSPSHLRFEQSLQKRLKDEAVAPGVVGDAVVEIARDVRPDVEADDIEQAVAAGFGEADQIAGERVDFFDGVVVFHGELLDGAAEETADAIADEVGRVFAVDDAFAEAAVAEFAEESEDAGIGFSAGDHLDQVQIARRVEEMRAAEMAAQIGAEAFGDRVQRECRWCWC